MLPRRSVASGGPSFNRRLRSIRGNPRSHPAGYPKRTSGGRNPQAEPVGRRRRRARPPRGRAGFWSVDPGGIEGSPRYEGGTTDLGLRREGARVATRMSKRLRSVLLLGSLAAVAGCVQGPDYERPTVAVPQDFRFQDATASFEADTGR